MDFQANGKKVALIATHLLYLRMEEERMVFATNHAFLP